MGARCPLPQQQQQEQQQQPCRLPIPHQLQMCMQVLISTLRQASHPLLLLALPLPFLVVALLVCWGCCLAVYSAGAVLVQMLTCYGASSSWMHPTA
jgi:hypothetical protein